MKLVGGEQMVQRWWRLAAGVAALAVASSASAQSFNQALARYRASQQDCAAAFQRRLDPPRSCTGRCLAAATVKRDKCLASAERRYLHILRQELQPRR